MANPRISQNFRTQFDSFLPKKMLLLTLLHPFANTRFKNYSILHIMLYCNSYAFYSALFLVNVYLKSRVFFLKKKVTDLQFLGYKTIPTKNHSILHHSPLCPLTTSSYPSIYASLTSSVSCQVFVFHLPLSVCLFL